MSLAIASRLREILDDIEVWDDYDRSVDMIIQLYPSLLRDAERYRHLKSKDIGAIHKGGVFAGKTPDNVVLNGDELDAAVDQSIKYEAAMNE